MIEIGTLLQDRYLIEEQIGAGGMGAVYRAIDQRFGSSVAIKETFYKDAEFSDAFEREAHLLNSLLHPALPHVSDYFTENNEHFLVMQFIEGEDLSATLKREGAFPVQDVIRWTDTLLDALDYLHSQEPPVIHRDIKPQNLKVTQRGDIILLDFGLAKLNSADTLGAMSVFGYSRTYSPLEQIQGTGTDARSDIFALGATAYHLLTGKPPVDVLSRAAAIVAGNSDPLRLANEINSNVPVAVAVLLKSALALNPSQRFVSAKAMRQALHHAFSSDAVEIGKDFSVPIQNFAPVIESPVVNSVDIEDFPALEAFVGEAKNLPEIAKEESFNKANVLPDVKTSVPPADTSFQPAYINNAATEVSVRRNQKSFPFAALAAILILAGLAAGYFLMQSGSSAETAVEPSVVKSSQDTITSAEQPKTDSVSYIPEKSADSKVELTEKNKETSVVKKPVSEKTETAKVDSNETETIEIPDIKPAEIEIAQPKPIQNTRSKPVQRPKQSAPRSVEEQPVPDIEAIFTGRASDNRDENEEIRQQDVIADEELKERRRQRRQERRERRNNQPLPF